MTLWLIGQLYRNGQKDDIVINEKLIFRELDKDKKLFLQKGHIIGMKYYIPYLLYCINRRFLKYIVKI